MGLWILDLHGDSQGETWLPFYNFYELLVEIKARGVVGGVHLKTD